MGISDSLVFGIILVLILCIMVAFFDFMLPIFKKAEFDAICRTASLSIEANNGLSEGISVETTIQLKKLGLENIIIQCGATNTVSRNDKIKILIEGNMNANFFEGIFKRTRKPILFRYETFVISRKVFN